jgi:hypothetical protein
MEVFLVLVVLEALVIIMLVLAVSAFTGLFKSRRFMADLKSHHDLMLKIGTQAADHFAGARGAMTRYAGGGPSPEDEGPGRAGSYRDSPSRGLMELIEGASEHFRRLKDTSRYIHGFVLGLFAFAIVILAVLVYFDVKWLGSDVCLGGGNFIIILLVLAGTYYMTSPFGFIQRRYRAIDYALKQPPTRVPEGKNPVDRYRRHLTGEKGYERFKDGSHWRRGDYFDAALPHEDGLVLVKYLKRTPTMDDLGRFRSQAESERGKMGGGKGSAGGKLERAVILFKEDPDDPLTEEVYDDVIGRPIRSGGDVCNIQLVVEGEDGTYDFIPLMSY